MQSLHEFHYLQIMWRYPITISTLSGVQSYLPVSILNIFLLNSCLLCELYCRWSWFDLCIQTN